jgi:hypothetical protein
VVYPYTTTITSATVSHSHFILSYIYLILATATAAPAALKSLFIVNCIHMAIVIGFFPQQPTTTQTPRISIPK